jgi:hypothetical protein
MVADSAAYGRQGVFFFDKLEGLLIFALSSQSHIPLDRNVRRACRLAWGGAALFYGKCSGYCLGVLAECRPADIETLVVFILAFDRTDFGAFAATRALGQIHMTGLLQKLYREISRLTGNLLNLGQGQKLDVEVPADLDQLGRNNSHRAVVCGEGLVELRHHPADGGGFFDQINIKTSVGKIERRLHAGDPTANDHNGTNRSFFLDLHESTPLKL